MSDQTATRDAPQQANVETPEQRQQRQMQAYLRAPVPKIYANGLGINGTASDVSIILLDNGVPAGVVTLAHTTAKSLVNDLNAALSTFEERTGEKIKDIKTLSAIFGRPKK